ncbi:hypothetical protein MSAN_00599700 [Mycena sanguinolenta]|uniref:Uncharacterized protein n=1 Tax=Mycena sanguinolenta TaxID=230812 RepID=A0A8H6Z7C2_9AGAR|nr:hypothetical protein MSAN_00599700 [Mycena sanguinolenta]
MSVPARVPASQTPALKAALMSSKKLNAIAWKVNTRDPQWTRDVISAFLNSFPGLRELRLEMCEYGWVDLPLGVIRGLRKLTAATLSPCSLPYIAKNIAENRYTLTSLHLLLNLIRVGGASQAESNQLADVFVQTVLPLHEDSLVELSCTANYESRWSFGRHWEDVISRLHRAEILSFSINAADISRNVAPENNAVTVLLTLTTRLVALSHLRIVAAGAERSRRNWLENPMPYNAAVNRSIVATVRCFRTEISSRASLRVGQKWYSLRPTPIAGDSSTEVEAEMSRHATRVLAYTQFKNTDSEGSLSLFN